MALLRMNRTGRKPLRVASIEPVSLIMGTGPRSACDH